MTSEQRHASDIFECQQCGECCTGFGGTYVTEEDIQAISKYIGTDPKTFATTYCQDSAGKKVLSVGEDNRCVFADKLCTIHPVKPRMCKAWPYLESVLKHPGNWNLMADACPGIKTDVPEAALKQCIQQEIDKLNR